jgi:aldehyde dehydrogenase (NAD+)
MRTEFSEARSRDLGTGPITNYLNEVWVVQREAKHAVQHLQEWTRPHSVDTPVLLGPARSYVKYEPLGVVCVMGSWNFPLFTTLGPMVQVIAAGNCCLVKPSELAPNCAKAISNLIEKYIGTECVQCVLGGVKVAIRCS